MKHDIFMDTSGFYALLVKRDDRHERASGILHEAGKTGRGFSTTDYILDETATLLGARGLDHIVPGLFEIVFSSKACRLLWMDQERFDKTRHLFLKYQGQGFSFTDCFSMAVMKET